VVASDHHNLGVELYVRQRFSVTVARRGGLCHLIDKTLQFIKVRVRHPCKRQARSQRFELSPDSVRLKKFGRAGTTDAGPSECSDLDNPERLETAQRFPAWSLA
jgi:hypothetical protein